jgi:hypothetical protein
MELALTNRTLTAREAEAIGRLPWVVSGMLLQDASYAGTPTKTQLEQERRLLGVVCGPSSAFSTKQSRVRKPYEVTLTARGVSGRR